MARVRNACRDVSKRWKMVSMEMEEVTATARRTSRRSIHYVLQMCYQEVESLQSFGRTQPAAWMQTVSEGNATCFPGWSRRPSLCLIWLLIIYCCDVEFLLMKTFGDVTVHWGAYLENWPFNRNLLPRIPKLSSKARFKMLTVCHSCMMEEWDIYISLKLTS